MLSGYEESIDAFTSTLRERASLPIAWWERRLKPFTGTGDMVFGVFREQALVGVSGLSLSGNAKTRHKARLFGMYVHPDFRGRGIASSLLDEILAFAHSNPIIQEVQLTVTEGNLPALNVYRRAEFLPWGTEPRAISSANGFLNKIHMHKAVT